MANLLFHTRCADPARSADVHEQMRDMLNWADGKFTDCTFAEHHLSGDGFMGNPLQAAAMGIGAGRSLKLGAMAILAPLYDPLFLAEQIAFLDLSSKGRFKTVFGLGYREAEYRAVGRDWAVRGETMNALVEQVLGLLRGETLEINGVEAQLHHLPVTDLNKIIHLGGSSRRAARRAARFDLPLAPPLVDSELEEYYVQCCAERGVEPRYQHQRFDGYTFIAEDPEAVWREVGSYLLYDAMAYQSMGNTQRRSWDEGSASDIASLREQGTYHILTPEQALEQYEQGNHISISPLTGGLPSGLGWKCLDLFETRMLPHMELDYRSYRELPA
jgi:alkanesulfonate monooxygenase SsuD/methylene tetrahydromethanopterin reductase-like flavin-dependent oxidoreductase (luciferase family)